MLPGKKKQAESPKIIVDTSSYFSYFLAISMKSSNRARRNTPEIKKVSVSFPEPILEYAHDRADKEFDGNLSLYVRNLIKKDRETAGAK